jgi:hypothetical protein
MPSKASTKLVYTFWYTVWKRERREEETRRTREGANKRGEE